MLRGPPLAAEVKGGGAAAAVADAPAPLAAPPAGGGGGGAPVVVPAAAVVEGVAVIQLDRAAYAAMMADVANTTAVAVHRSFRVENAERAAVAESKTTLGAAMIAMAGSHAHALLSIAQAFLSVREHASAEAVTDILSVLAGHAHQAAVAHSTGDTTRHAAVTAQARMAVRTSVAELCAGRRGAARLVDDTELAAMPLFVVPPPPATRCPRPRTQAQARARALRVMRLILSPRQQLSRGREGECGGATPQTRRKRRSRRYVSHTPQRWR